MSMARVDGSRFQDRVMVITGAAQGIGRRVAERAAAEGARLALVDRADIVQEVVEELTAQGVDAIALQADLETWEGAEDVMARSVAHFGRIDILINNVGGAINFKP
ncbi:MAG: SDR family NAD(P)-dependent oxidoreductase, partial [Halomonas sp.]|nr:SDR family NAD(P)-dependent oxidoreductase [Halomonas sp.]